MKRSDFSLAALLKEATALHGSGRLAEAEGRYEKFLNDVLDQELAHITQDTGISEAQREKIQERLRAKLMHPPTQKIKDASRNGGVTRYLEALHALFDLDKK